MNLNLKEVLHHCTTVDQTIVIRFSIIVHIILNNETQAVRLIESEKGILFEMQQKRPAI